MHVLYEGALRKCHAKVRQESGTVLYLIDIPKFCTSHLSTIRKHLPILTAELLYLDEDMTLDTPLGNNVYWWASYGALETDFDSNEEARHLLKRRD